MSLVQLSDVVIPSVYSAYDSVNSPEKTEIVTSGIIRNDPLLNQLASNTNGSVTIPFYNDLDSDAEPNVSSDDDSVKATPQKITTGKQIAWPSSYNQLWKAADLASEASGSSPNQRIRDRTEAYWSRQLQRKSVMVAEAILKDSVANHDSDMVVDVFTEDGSAATAGNKFSDELYSEAAFTLGDMFSNTGILIMHSTVYKTLRDQQKIDSVRNADGKLLYKTYNEHRIIVDDGAYTRAGTTSGLVYTTILCGSGSFGFGQGVARVPVAIQRDETEGNGGGTEILVNRKRWLLHPYGFKAETPAGNGYTNAELSSAATFTRVVDRRNIPLAFIRTNG